MRHSNPDTATALVLLCDPETKRRQALAAALRAEQLNVVDVDSSASAVACLEQDTPLIVLVVGSKRDPDSFSLCSMIAHRGHWDAPSVVMLFDKDDAHLCPLARDSGAIDILMLPCADGWFVERVRHHTNLAQTRRDLLRSEIAHAHAERLAHIGSWEWNTETNQMRWSDETFRVLGYEHGETEMTHTAFWQRVHPDDRQQVQDEAGEALDVASAYTTQHRIRLDDGTIKHVRQQGELIVADGRRGRWLAGTIQDITQQRLDQERIRYLANYDSLTGLANRRMFGERLEQAVASAKLEKRRIGLLYMDLDKFKRINDTLGHSAGDQLLRHVANLLRAHTRGADLVGRPEHRRSAADVSRLGGDEFLILLTDVAEAEDAGQVAQRILEALPETVEIDHHAVSALGSIGIAVFPEDGQDAETLVRHADTAMYHAKDCGRNNYKFFCHSMNEVAQRKMLIESRLRLALENDAVQVHYQPKVRLADGSIYGMEGLARWDDSELGGISPREFVALAEETGQILDLGKQVLTSACRFTQELLREHGTALQVSVNVSSQQFCRDDFRQVVGDALDESGLDPAQLELEITESLMLQDDEATALTMRDLNAIGVSISLDDFGTGYSSLSYLTRFPLNSVKLDRCFVRDISTDPAAAGVASSVVAMAHSLGLEVVAEGVDAPEQRQILEEWGCDCLQGFLIAGALPEDEFRRFVRDYNDDEKPEV